MSDIISLVLQATGGAKASGALTYEAKQVGIHVMVAGLALQVVSLLVFIMLCADFGYSVHRSTSLKEPMLENFRASRKFRIFLWGTYSH